MDQLDSSCLHIIIGFCTATSDVDKWVHWRCLDGTQSRLRQLLFPEWASQVQKRYPGLERRILAFNGKRLDPCLQRTRVERELSWKETLIQQDTKPLLLKIFDSNNNRVPQISTDPFTDRISDLRSWVHQGLFVYFAVDCGQDHRWNKNEGELHLVQWCGKEECSRVVVPANNSDDKLLCTLLFPTDPLKEKKKPKSKQKVWYIKLPGCPSRFDVPCQIGQIWRESTPHNWA